MNLNKLEIRRLTYGPNIGSFEGKISFDNELGKVDINLSPEQCQELFKVCAEGIVDTAKEAAKNLTISVVEHDTSVRGISND